MDVADEMNKKREVAGPAPFVIIPVTKALRVLVDFRRDRNSLAGTAPVDPFPCPEGRYRCNATGPSLYLVRGTRCQVELTRPPSPFRPKQCRLTRSEFVPRATWRLA